MTGSIRECKMALEVIPAITGSIKPATLSEMDLRLMVTDSSCISGPSILVRKRMQYDEFLQAHWIPSR
jgi:hypothetical protein